MKQFINPTGKAESRPHEAALLLKGLNFCQDCLHLLLCNNAPTLLIFCRPHVGGVSELWFITIYWFSLETQRHIAWRGQSCLRIRYDLAFIL